MNNNIFLAVILSLAILMGFQTFVAKPQQEAARSYALVQKTQTQTQTAPTVVAPTTLRPRQDVLKEATRVRIESPELVGSINLKGARLDDLQLTGYRETGDAGSPAITLLSPSGSDAPHRAYYAEFNWLSGPSETALPTADTVWKADGAALTPAHPVKLTWDNQHGLVFERTVAIDDHFLFTVTDRVVNKGNVAVTLYPFGLVARQGMPQSAGSSVVHEGGLGVIDGTLAEYKYKKLIDLGKRDQETTGGWFGITDKYWLVALIPPQDEKITAEFAFNPAGQSDPALGFFQSDFRGKAIDVAAGGTAEHVAHLFAGAKRIHLLDQYADQYNIPHFDKAIDFGWFYFLTKPFLYLLAMLANAVGSIGVAILLFTVLLKVATLPLSLKSYHSMARMKALQPEMKVIQERYAEDKVRQSQEMMELYKREKVSPVSGCLPTLIQIPIFFALYKVLYVNIEMRQASFFGWIHDMSMSDPTSVLNGFGLLPFGAPSFLHIGAWPLLMGASMYLQQRLSPQPPDASQARVLQFMPLLFTYMLASMPAGLVIYWTWSNLIGIAQQWFIMSRDAKRKVV